MLVKFRAFSGSTFQVHICKCKNLLNASVHFLIGWVETSINQTNHLFNIFSHEFSGHNKFAKTYLFSLKILVEWKSLKHFLSVSSVFNE